MSRNQQQALASLLSLVPRSVGLLVFLCLSNFLVLGWGVSTDVASLQRNIAFVDGATSAFSGGRLASLHKCSKYQLLPSLSKFQLVSDGQPYAVNGVQQLRATMRPDDGSNGRDNRKRSWRGQPGGDGILPGGDSGAGGGGGSRIPRAFKTSGSPDLDEVVELTKKRGPLSPFEENNDEDDAEGSSSTTTFRREEREATGESFWIEYQMRVICDTPYAAPFQPPMQAVEKLEMLKANGEINDEDFAARKKEIVSKFWRSLIEGSGAQRTIQPRDVVVQVTNDADFADSWMKQKVIESGQSDIGVSVQWVPVSKRQSGKRGGTRKGRHRISILQIATANEVLVLQMAHIRPSKIPKLVAQVLSDSNVVKHGARILDSSIKMAQDWGFSIMSRVDSCDYAASLGYSGKDLCEVAKSVLALNYTRPEWVLRSDWEALTLSDMQITCAALDAWISREAVMYMQGVSKTRPLVDTTTPSAALAQRGMDEGQMEKKSSSPGQKQVTLDEERPPDRVLYIPKVDVREGGSHAHWLWRGTRISDKHIEQYCGVKLQLDDTDEGSATVAHLWGEEAALREAVELMGYLLARSQLESQYSALGLGPPQFINRPDEEGGMSSMVILNTMEVVEWSFFPTTLTRSFQGKSMQIRGRGWTKDVARAAFFSQAHASSIAADAMLGTHRPKMIEGPLPPGLDPAIMWRVSNYRL